MYLEPLLILIWNLKSTDIPSLLTFSPDNLQTVQTLSTPLTLNISLIQDPESKHRTVSTSPKRKTISWTIQPKANGDIAKETLTLYSRSPKDTSNEISTNMTSTRPSIRKICSAAIWVPARTTPNTRTLQGLLRSCQIFRVLWSEKHIGCRVFINNLPYIYLIILRT